MEMGFQQEKSCSSIWPEHGNTLVRLRRDVSCRDGRSQTLTLLLSSHTWVLSVCCKPRNCSEARRDLYTEAEGFWRVEEKLAFKNEVRYLVRGWKLCLFGLWSSVKIHSPVRLQRNRVQHKWKVNNRFWAWVVVFCFVLFFPSFPSCIGAFCLDAMSYQY